MSSLTTSKTDSSGSGPGKQTGYQLLIIEDNLADPDT